MKKVVIILLILGAAFYFYNAKSETTKRIPVTDLPSALWKANEEGKYMFVLFGREGCGNCQALRGYINTNKLSLPEEKFVYADINCDDKQSADTFHAYFKMSGKSLPFVVIADSHGQQIATRSGSGSPEAFSKFINEVIAYSE